MPRRRHRRTMAGMIQEVDEGLRALILRDVINGAAVDISFEAPTREWSARRNTPTVNVYLYDVREDLSRREVMHVDVRDDEGRITGRRPPSRRFRLSYLLTAWTQRPEDEHRMLDALLGCFLQADQLPDDVLMGALATAALPVITSVALPPAQDRSFSDIWSALGGELKPSLDLCVIAPFDPGRFVPAAPLVEEGPRIALAPRAPGGGEALADPVTPRTGHPAPAARSSSTAARGGPQPFLPAGAELGPDLPAEQDDTVGPASAGGPGRAYHFRGIPRR